MKQRRKLLVGMGLLLALAALLIGLFVWPVGVPRQGETERQFLRIHKGMKLAEVEAAFGRTGDLAPVNLDESIYVWEGEDGTASVSFIWYNNGVNSGLFQAKDGRTVELNQSEESLIDALRRRLGL